MWSLYAPCQSVYAAALMYAALVLSLVVTAASPPSQRLAEAKQLVEDLQYDKALKAVDAALAQNVEIDRDTLRGLYELAAISAATLDRPARAREAFSVLLSLVPDYQLSKNLPPRTRTPFFEARSWAENNPPLSVQVEPTRNAQRITALALTVKDNPLVPARSVRITLGRAGREDQVVTLKLEAHQATVAVDAPAVKWKVEVLGDKGVLHVATGEARPPEPVVELLPPPLPPLAGTQGAAGGGWARTAGIVVGAVGAAALVGGGIVGGLSADARARIARAERDAAGVVTGLTQRQASELDAAAITQAKIANGLFVAGGVLAAAGVGLILIDLGSAPKAASVTVLLSPLTGSVSGRF